MPTEPAPLDFGQYHVARRADGTLWELGRGAMGVTYRAFDTKLKIEVVLKLIHPDVLQSERTKRLFLREARAAAKVRHPNIAAVINLHDEDPFYYAMEFVAGSALSEVIKARGVLPLAEALDYTDQVAAALSAMAREHIVHRDLKPSNLMFLADEEQRFGQLVKVIDFGLARGFSVEGENVDTYLASSLSQSGIFTGTPYYASPEQCGTLVEPDTRSDLYSLGVILWEMLSGRRPFTGGLGQVLAMHQFKEPPVEQLAGLPEAIVALLLKLLAKEREDRFQTPRELRTALGACAAESGSATIGSQKVFVTASAAPGTESMRLGTTLAERFQLGPEIAEGDGGKLFRAMDVSAGGKLVALKLLAKSASGPESVRRLDAQFGQMRAYPTAVCLPTAGAVIRAGASVFFVREWVEGFSLQELLATRGELRASEVRRILAELPAAIDHAAAHGFAFAEVLLRKLFVSPPAGVEAASDWPALRSRPVEEWPAFRLRWNAVSIRTEAGTTGSMTQTSVEPPGVVDEPVVSLACLLRELLGGRPGTLTPLPALGDEANATLRRALGPGGGRLAFESASMLWDALLLGGGKAFYAPAASASLPAPALKPAPPKPSWAPQIVVAAITALALALAGWWWLRAPDSSAPGSPVAGSLRQRAAAIVVEGDRLRDAAKWDEAVLRYGDALKLDPRSRDAFVGRGFALGKRRQFVEAITDFDEAIRIDPKHALAYARRGTIYAALRQDEVALQDCNEAIRLDPKLAEAYERRGWANASLLRREAAIADFDEAIRLNEKFGTAYSGRGRQFAFLGQRERAIADCDEGVRLDPQSAAAFAARADVLSNLGQKEKALEDFAEALRLDPRSSTIYTTRGSLLAGLGQRDRAIQDFNESIRLDPKFPRAFAGRGSAYAGLGQQEKAMHDFDEAIRLDPKYAGAYNGRGGTFANLGQKERALKDFDDAIRLDPKFTSAFLNRAAALVDLGKPDQAVKDYDEAIRLDPKTPTGFAGRGIAYAALKQHARALTDYDEALRLAPKSANTLANRGAAYANLGQNERALKDYDEAIHLDPKNTYAFYNRGVARMAVRQFDEAIRDYDEAIRLNSKFPSWFEGRAKAYRALNNTAAAERDEAKAREMRATPGAR